MYCLQDNIHLNHFDQKNIFINAFGPDFELILNLALIQYLFWIDILENRYNTIGWSLILEMIIHLVLYNG
jgi:hypothetical protein